MILDNIIDTKRTMLKDLSELLTATEKVPIGIERLISLNKNIRIIYAQDYSKIIIKGSRALIFIDSSLPYRLRREVLAEEYAHYLLHSGVQLSASISTLKQEHQAKVLAAYLLCPWSLLKDQQLIEGESYFIEELADKFEVSYEFMQYRLELELKNARFVTKYKDELYFYSEL